MIASMLPHTSSSLCASQFIRHLPLWPAQLRTGELRDFLAGHHPPRRPRRGRAALRSWRHPLCHDDGMGYLDSIDHLCQGEALFLYTDGVSDARNIPEDDSSDDCVIASLIHSSATTCGELIAPT
jgi:hypothetical protein